MKNLLPLSIFLFFFSSINLQAQDVIIKTDRTEITAKVLEVEESNIKYKLFDFQDGPTYNIRKNDIFMIIYKNGKRETFEPITTANPEKDQKEEGNSALAKNKPTQEKTTSGLTNWSNSTESNTEEDVDYGPLKILAYSGGYSGAIGGTDYGATAIMFEMSGDSPLIKNFLNWGLNTYYMYVGGSSSASYGSAFGESNGYGFGAYAAGYFSLNRLLGNIEKQNVGLFPYVRAGLVYSYHTFSANSTVDDDYYYESPDFESSGFGGDYRIGLDYKFSKGFGVTVASSFVGGFGGGLNFQW